MKIAVYTIVKNEEKFIERWYNSAKDADYLLLADTGSTDGTVEKARSLGINVIQVNVNPWRFDDARNASLTALPLDIDYCIPLDADEVLVEGWREKIEKINPETTRLRYKYTWNWNPDGTPGLVFGADKIHARKGYRWKNAVHEVVMMYSGKEIVEWCELEIHHHADDTKNRSQYLPLLEMSVREEPYNDRNAYYYARELFFYGMFDESREQFNRHLNLPTATWKPERVWSMRYLAKMSIGEEKESWLKKAVEELPNRRESLVDLSRFYYDHKEWEKCNLYASLALNIEKKPLDYLCEDEAWTWLPHDLKAISAYNLKKFDEALEHGKLALSFLENDRLRKNVEFYEAAIEGN